MSNITQEEIEKLQATKSGDEWDAVCDEIKAVRGDQYPDDWFDVVIRSGMASKIEISWQE